jgi:hypothetical protein
MKISSRFRKIILAASGLFLCTQANAQRFILNMPEHDQKPYYFGITFGLNFTEFRIRYTEAFAQTDTFKKIQPGFGPGFNLGLMGNLRLSKRLDIRTVPSLSFAEKKLTYTDPQNGEADLNKSIESIYLHLPLQLKFKSDRIKNFRFYAMGGGKFDYDLAANARSRRDDEFLKVKPADLGFEFGVGFEFYNANFIFSPEIKVSQGLTNQLYKDGSLPLTNAIDQIKSRSIVISIHLEG